jgi:hypothetical protein
MALTEKNKQSYSATEIAVLTNIINYCDRMIYEDKTLDVRNGLVDSRGYISTSQAPLYRLLRRSAYAKTVVIETELLGVQEFRLSSTEAVYPNRESGYCTPHTAVGRLITFVTPGYQGRSKLWGEYRVVEVRSFDRYSGPAFEPNVRNFSRMDVNGDRGDGFVANLLSYQASRRDAKSKDVRKNPQLKPISSEEIREEVVPAEVPSDAQQTTVQIAKFHVVDEAEDQDVELDIDHGDDPALDKAPVKVEEYFGLNERFFTHQTAEQNQIIARSPVGAMFVEGVAGSGKTSAALGRTKMLTTFNPESVVDEQAFRDVVGQEQEYWSGQFAGQFSQESCVGFVRTGELIQYLQETCRRIDLPHLPVKEYKELQTRLREQRRITSSTIPGRRWSGLARVRAAHKATTMAWLHSTDQLIARRIASSLIPLLPNSEEVAELFEVNVRDKVRRVTKVAVEHLTSELQSVAAELCRKPRPGGFALDRLASRLMQKLDDVRKRVMAPKVIWVRVNGITLFASDENALARKLIELNTKLYLRSGRRLVFVNDNGPADPSLNLLNNAGEPVTWSEDTRQLMAEGKVIVPEDSGNHVVALPSDVNHLFMRLLPEATERIYVQENGELRRLVREQGLGRIKLPVISSDREEDLGEDDSEILAETTAHDQVRKRTPDAEFARIVRRRLLQPLANLADLYLATLEAESPQFPDSEVAETLRAQLSEFKLTDDDIDLLLCVSHIAGRGLKQGGLSQLREIDTYQAVFVDEVQDFTEQQVFLMVEQANPKYQAVTVVGDIAQKLHHGSSIDLPACFPGRSVPHVRLTVNMRQANMPGLALFSTIFRSELQNDILPTADLVAEAKAQGAALTGPSFLLCDSNDAMEQLIIDTLANVARSQTVAVLFPTAAAAATAYERLGRRLQESMIEAEITTSVNLARRHIRHFAAVANAKGLEFDVVLLVGVDGYNLENATEVNHLYVGITRARQSLILLSGGTTVSPKLLKVRALYENLIAK